MKDKILVLVYVPLLEQEYDIYIPIVKKIGTVKNYIIDIISEMNDGNFDSNHSQYLYDKLTGDILDENLFVKQSNIKNGTKLILY